MRGQTVAQLLAELRAECGYSQSQAHGINNRETLVQVMKRTQRRLWADWDWMHLRVSRDIRLVEGQRYYSCPDDLPYERIDDEENRPRVKYGGRWTDLYHGINERHYSTYDPEYNERSWPIRAWDITEDPADTAGTPDNRGMIEVWPLPSASGSEVTGDKEGWIRLTGTRFLNPFEADDDRADLDGDLIVLFSAAEIIARDRKEDAQAKLQMAQSIYQKLKGNYEKTRQFVLGGETTEPCHEQPEIFAHPVPFSYGGSTPAPVEEVPYLIDTTPSVQTTAMWNATTSTQTWEVVLPADTDDHEDVSLLFVVMVGGGYQMALTPAHVMYVNGAIVTHSELLQDMETEIFFAIVPRSAAPALIAEVGVKYGGSDAFAHSGRAFGYAIAGTYANELVQLVRGAASLTVSDASGPAPALLLSMGGTEGGTLPTLTASTPTMTEIYSGSTSGVSLKIAAADLLADAAVSAQWTFPASVQPGAALLRFS